MTVNGTPVHVVSTGPGVHVIADADHTARVEMTTCGEWKIISSDDRAWAFEVLDTLTQLGPPHLLRSRPIQEFSETLYAQEVRAVQLALMASNGNRDVAAESLGISRATVQRKIKRYNLYVPPARRRFLIYINSRPPLAMLTEREWSLWERRISNSRATLNELAREWKISAERVRQIEKKLIQRLEREGYITCKSPKN